MFWYKEEKSLGWLRCVNLNQLSDFQDVAGDRLVQQQKDYQMMTLCILQRHPLLQYCHGSLLRAYFRTCL